MSIAKADDKQTNELLFLNRLWRTMTRLNVTAGTTDSRLYSIHFIFVFFGK